MPECDKKHTPLVSRQQQKFFGAELARKKEGKATKTGMSEEKLVGHLKESRGKDLPEKISKSLSDRINNFVEKQYKYGGQI